MDEEIYKQRKRSGGHDLSHKMRSTKGSRFVADERMKKTSKLSSIALSFLSVEIIAINLMDISGIMQPSVTASPEYFSNLVSTGTIILSILVLVFGVLENAKQFDLKAERYHKCGVEINKLFNILKVELAKNNNEDFNDSDFLNELNTKYEAILESYSNHEIIDFWSYQIQNNWIYDLSPYEILKKRFLIYFRSTFIYHILILAGPISMLFFVFK